MFTFDHFLFQINSSKHVTMDDIQLTGVKIIANKKIKSLAFTAIYFEVIILNDIKKTVIMLQILKV